MPPPAPREKADEDDIFGDAGTGYVCDMPKVSCRLQMLQMPRVELALMHAELDQQQQQVSQSHSHRVRLIHTYLGFSCKAGPLA